jgi:2-polyprenyl-3-methyl-5-hydroxy-6-metoxy-1,4-benzoquinol methylase
VTISEVLLKQYAKLVAKPRKVRTQSPADYFRWQVETSPALFALIPNLDLKGKRVLEIGCGTGGRSAWLAQQGPAEVVAIDVNGPEIELARELAKAHCPELRNLIFHQSKEDGKLDIGEFDVVLLIDSLEHVHSPCKILKLAYSYTRPGGRAYFTTVGWYHHAGSHTGYPFANVFFSDEIILNVIRWQVSRPGYQRSMWDSDPPIARWNGIYDLRNRPGEYLNKITIRQMKRLVRYSDFGRHRLHILGFRNSKLRWLNPLSQIPGVQEMIHSFVVGEFMKPLDHLAYDAGISPSTN